MQYYVNFDENGNVLGFYLDEIHAENVPIDAIPITNQEWSLYISKPSLIKLDNGVIREKTADEIKVEKDALPIPALSDIEKLRLEQAQANAELFEMVLMMTGGGL